MATLAPSRAKSSAAARPIPRERRPGISALVHLGIRRDPRHQQ
jgi:hypothetical protein